MEEENRVWSKLYDSDLSQWQIVDEARVIATGIESEQDADRLLRGSEIR